jgi:hypothetical protein
LKILLIATRDTIFCNLPSYFDILALPALSDARTPSSAAARAFTGHPTPPDRRERSCSNFWTVSLSFPAPPCPSPSPRLSFHRRLAHSLGGARCRRRRRTPATPDCCNSGPCFVLWAIGRERLPLRAKQAHLWFECFTARIVANFSFVFIFLIKKKSSPCSSACRNTV